MRTVARAFVLAGALAPAALALPGCCGIAREICGIEATSPPRTSRDTPLGAVDNLIEAFHRRAPTEVFESLHPEYVEENGGFSATQFATAWERYEPEFREDARTLAAATKEAPLWRDGDAWVRVHDASGAEVWLVFRNRPACRVIRDDEFAPEIRAPLPPLSEVVAVEGDGLVLLRPLPLQGEGEFLDPSTVRRVEIHQDWLLRKVVKPRNIRFVDRMVEEMKGDPR